MAVDPNFPSLKVSLGQTRTLDMLDHTSYSSSDSVTYKVTSSNTSVVKATMSGRILSLKGLAIGDSFIHVTCTGPYTDNFKFNAVVEQAGTPPIIVKTIPNETFNVGDRVDIMPYQYFNNSTGDPLDGLSFKATSSNTNVADVGITGWVLVGTATGPGTATITVTATNSYGSVKQTYTITVAGSTNKAPVYSTIPTKNMDTYSKTTVNLNNYFSDPDGNSLTYTAKSSSTGVTSVSVSGSTLTINSLSPGTATITVTASDGKTSINGTFTVIVTQSNRAPSYLGLSEQMTMVGQRQNINLNNLFSDPDGNTLTYTATSNNTSLVTPTLSGSTLIIDSLSAGIAKITVVANDGTTTTSGTFNVNVSNNPPIYTQIPTQYTTKNKAATVNLNNYFTSPDNLTMTYTAKSANTSIVSTSVSNNNLTISGVSKGIITVTVTAKSGTATISRDFTVVVENSAPTYTQIPPQYTTKNKTVNVNLKNYFSDIDNDAFTYKVSSANPNVATVSNSGSNLTITGVAKGSAIITVNASDGSLSTSQNFTVQVTNTGPTFMQIPNQTTKKNITVNVDLLSYFSDIDGDGLSFMATTLNADIVTVNITNKTLLITGKELGMATVTVDASDGSATASQNISVIVVNSEPVLTLSSPNKSFTLYSSDSVDIIGNVTDVDTNQNVNVYVQINDEQPLMIASGSNSISFNKKVTFRENKMYYDEKVVSGELIKDTTYKIRVWSEDDQKGKSNVVEYDFNVIPNRIPDLIVSDIVTDGLIDMDKCTISGFVSDQDENPTITVSYKLNTNNSVEVYKGSGGAWKIEFPFSDLKLDENILVVEAVDNFGSKSRKQIRLSKKANSNYKPISISRYNLNLPNGVAKSVLVFIERHKDLEIEVELSMINQGEPENYVLLKLESTNGIASRPNIVEDTFYYESPDVKDKATLKITQKKLNENDDYRIYSISGVIE